MTSLSKPAGVRYGHFAPVQTYALRATKRLVVRAYCRGWISFDTVQAVFARLPLKDA